MSTPVKKNSTSNDVSSKTKAATKDRRVAGKVVDRDSGSSGDDIAVTYDEREVPPPPSEADAVTNAVSPPPPKADAATGSTKPAPSNNLMARGWRELEPVAQDVSATVRSASRRVMHRSDRAKSSLGSRPEATSEIDLDVDSQRPSTKGEQARSSVPRLFSKRVGGVAPFVSPNQRLSRRARLGQLNQRGFVPLSPGKQKLRHRILPRTIIGIATMLMCVGIGAAFSGAAFYAYYDDRLAENERTVARFVEGFDQQFTDAAGALDDLRVGAVEEIRTELGPLEDQVTDAEGVITLPKDIGPSVWMLETRDEDGQIANGAAFAIVGHRGGTALVTSYELTIASTTAPSPGIDIVKGNRRIPAQLWAWDPERDLALVVVEEVIPPLKLAGENAQIEAVGGRVFAMSGVGGQGATASPGVLLDHSLSGLQHTVPVGTLFTGGPLVDGEGKVVGVAASNYRPYGLDPGAVAQAPDVRSICAVVLECSEIREEVVVEVVNEETEAPERGEEPVREVEAIDEEDGEEEVGDTTTIDPNEEPAEENEGDAVDGATTETSDAEDPDS